MAFVNVAAIVSTASTVYNMVEGADAQSQAGQQGAAAADPFASQRGIYQPLTAELFNRLMNFSGDGYKDDPQYKALVESGIDTVNMGSAAQGMLRSGNRDAALQKVGMNAASQTINNRWQQLFGLLQQGGNLSGANSGSPGTAGQLTAQGISGSQNATANGINSLFQSAGGLFGKNGLFGGGSNGAGNTTTPTTPITLPGGGAGGF